MEEIENYKPQLSPQDLEVKAEMKEATACMDIDTEQLFDTLHSDCIENEISLREGWERLKAFATVDPLKLFGYFNSDSDTPAYDPGKECECIICYKPLSAPMVTNSFAVAGKSWFFRAHKACFQACSSEDIWEIESSAIDND